MTSSPTRPLVSGTLQLVTTGCLGACLVSACSPSDGQGKGAQVVAPPEATVPLDPAPTPSAPPTDSTPVVDEEVLVDEVPVPNDAPAAGDLDTDNACEAVSSEGEQLLRPMDVIIVIDNSGSMGEEIESVERNINVNFAAILDQSKIDYRVIMLSAYRGAEPIPGSEAPWFAANSLRVCVEPPLGPAACEGRAAGVSPHNLERFLHFDQPIGSRDAACLMLETLTGPPVPSHGFVTQEPSIGDDPMLQAGWTAHLRPDAFKAFIMITDDTLDCQTPGLDFESTEAEAAAAKFDELLRTGAPEQFGEMGMDRKYAWHSIVGVEPNADAMAVYEATDAMVGEKCDTAENPGAPHQELSRLTEGLRYPVCNADSYDSIFKRIATEIVQGAALPCSWEIPEPPDGQTFDKNQVNLAYTPGDGSPAPELGRVDEAGACGDVTAWYYDDPENPTTVNACPAACDLFTADLSGGKVDLLFGCNTTIPDVK